MNATVDTQEPLTTGQIAKYCYVTHRAVLKWVASGKLKAYRTPGKHSRVNLEDFVGFLQEYNMPVPEELMPLVVELKAASARKRVLIVDDDRGIVLALNRLLSLDNKYSIETAFDGFEAGAKFNAFRPQLIILDIRMPGLDGYQVCANIRRDPANKDIKILVISGINEPQEIRRILDLGANDFLEKPFSNDVLQEKIQRMLG